MFIHKLIISSPRLVLVRVVSNFIDTSRVPLVLHLLEGRNIDLVDSYSRILVNASGTRCIAPFRYTIRTSHCCNSRVGLSALLSVSDFVATSLFNQLSEWKLDLTLPLDKPRIPAHHSKESPQLSPCRRHWVLHN